MGRHLIRALTQDGLDEGSQSTKYTQVALKKGTSLGPSLFTWRRQNKDNTQKLGTQKPTVRSKALLLSPRLQCIPQPYTTENKEF